MTNLDAALYYARRGWAVFRLAPKTKIPMKGSHGLKDATTSPQQIHDWWTANPNCNVALATGSVSGVLVLDLDAKDGRDGRETLQALEAEHGALPDTIEAQTGSGGGHLFFKLPAGMTIQSTQDVLGPGIEVKADGGAVTLSPSRHPNGKRYHWFEDYGPGERELADVPAWLLKLIAAPKAKSDLDDEGSIPKSQRDTTLTSIAGRLSRQGLDEAQLYAALSKVNEAQCRPPLDNAQVHKIAKSVAGYRAAEGDEIKAPVIRVVPGHLPLMVDQVERALLAAKGNLYQRAGQMVTITRLKARQEDEGVVRPENALVIRAVTAAHLTEVLTRVARFVKHDERTKLDRQIDCPNRIAATYMARPSWRVPVLTGIVEAPTLRPDGSILSNPEYDESTGLYMDAGATSFPEIPTKPTRRDARDALEKLKHPIRHFPFFKEADESVALAAMLTVLIRPSLRSAPMFGFSAPTMGSGKSLLADVVSLLGTGRPVPTTSQSRSAEEDQKKLLALLLAGDPVVCIDNVERPVAGDTISTILTQSVFTGRLLGQNVMAKVPTTTTFLVTGNNLSFAGDMVTRALLCFIDAKCERPEERVFRRDLRAWVSKHRGELVAAGLTVLRAYHVAGRPAQDIKPYGRFEDWSNWIRSALVWLGQVDPCETRRRIEAVDPVRLGLGALLRVWRDEFKYQSVTAAQVVGASTDSSDLANALHEVVDDGRGGLSAQRLGMWLKKMEGRIHDGLKIRRRNHDRSGAVLWRIEDVNAGAAGAAGTLHTRSVKVADNSKK